MDSALHSDHSSKKPDTRNSLTQELISEGGHDEQFVYRFMCSRRHCRKRFKSMEDFQSHFHGCRGSTSFKLNTRHTQKQELISASGSEHVSLHEKSEHKSQEAHPGMPLYKDASLSDENDFCLTCSRFLTLSGRCYNCDDKHYLKKSVQKYPKKSPRQYGSKLFDGRRESFIKKNRNTQNQNQLVSESANEHTLCLLYESLSEKKLTLAVIEVSNAGPSRESFITLDQSPWIKGMGFGSLGTICYLVGGVIESKPSPCNVFICDISKEEKKWEIGPSLNYGKPDPIIFTINEKLYVLAGRATGTSGAYKKIFEVFDPVYGKWKLLQDPPFLSLFKQRYPYPKYIGHTIIGCVIYLQVSQSKTEENPALYYFNTENEKWSIYLRDSGQTSFAPGSDDQILHNLRCGDWRGRSDVVDYMMFHTTGRELKNLEVYAVDLTSSLEDFENRMFKLHRKGLYFDDKLPSESDDEAWDGLGLEGPGDVLDADPEDVLDSDTEDTSSFDPKDTSNFIPLVSYEKAFRENDADENKEIECVKKKNEIRDFNSGNYILLTDGNVPSVAVYGLTQIVRFIPQQALLGSCVIHLRKNLFALVISFTSIMNKDNDFERCARVKICTFELLVNEVLDGDKFSERYGAAYNVNEMTWVQAGLGILTHWCKIPNDGRQSHFRRPQLCDTSKKFCSHIDGIANQVVQKENFFPDYVQRV